MQRGNEWWDDWFLGMAKYVATASKDPSTQTGALIVRPDNTVASLGFNGFPRRMNDHEKLYADREIKLSRIIHCEMNAILHCKEDMKGYTLYIWPFLPCDRCAVHIIQSGIKKVVAPKNDVERWQAAFVKSRSFFAEAAVEVREV